MTVEDEKLRPNSRRAFRNYGALAMPCVALIFLGAICGMYAFQDIPVVGRVIFFTFAVGGVCIVVRILRSGVVVTESGLEVRGWSRTRQVRWTDVVGFRRVSASALNSSVFLAVELRDGSYLKTSGLTSSKAGSFGARVLGELEALRRAELPESNKP